MLEGDGWLCWSEMGVSLSMLVKLGRWVAMLEGDGWLCWREMGGYVG
jgi:hypothetical protein